MSTAVVLGSEPVRVRYSPSLDMKVSLYRSRQSIRLSMLAGGTGTFGMPSFRYRLLWSLP